MNQITEILVDIIAAAMSTALIYLLREGVQYLKSKSNSEKVQLALQEFQTVLEDGINFVEQTYVRVAKDGDMWDMDAQKRALQTCAGYVRDNLTQTTLGILTDGKSDIESWIESKIEAQIQQMKFR